ncbi:MAG: hypothetical protein AAFX46_14725, partial [Cyanobacteria bacterium J06636_27]
MVNQFYSTPSIDPLHRLNVRDGLEVNAERWELAHRYHKHRQNIHYQSLNEPGIVCGLGIQIIEAPQTSRANLHKQGRWLKIQPGIAIDIEGNPIIVDENKSIDRSFPFVSPRISNKNFDEEITVYLVVSYVDSRRLTDEEYWKTDKERWKEREWFRFDQQLEPPNERQIELCRIKLLVEDIALDRFELKKPQNVFSPKLNEIDLRYRPSAKAKPQALVNIATTAVESYNPRFPTSNINHNLTCLMQSLDALYPSLQGNTEVVNINLEETFNLENIDLLHIPFGQIQNLYRSSNNDGKYFLNSYWEKGGVILIEADSKIEGNSQNITSDINSLFKSLDKNYVYLKEWGSDDLD